MAAASEKHPARWRRPFNIWLEGIETGWSIPLLLALFVAVWTAYLVVAYLGAGLHPDAIAWQQHLGLNECSPGDLIKGRCGNVGDVAAYIEANRGIDGDGPQRTSGRRAEEAVRGDG